MTTRATGLGRSSATGRLASGCRSPLPCLNASKHVAAAISPQLPDRHRFHERMESPEIQPSMFERADAAVRVFASCRHWAATECERG